MKILSFIFIFILFSSFQHATIINVPADQPTIQDGINAATDTDTVLVQPGTYFENINYYERLITVASLFLITRETDYISQTIIDGYSNGHVVTFELGEDSSAVLCGFTIRNGYAIGTYPVNTGGGIHCNGSSPSLKNLNILENSAYNGAGIGCVYNSNPIISNTIVAQNEATNHGGAIFCGSSNPNIRNITTSSNFALEGEGGAIYVANSYPMLTNSILWGDYSQISPEIFVESGVIDVNYTNVHGSWPFGIGNLNVEPNFLDNTNYKLSILNLDNTAQNFCVDAGDPSDPIDNEPMPNGDRINMGAYGGTSQAAFSAMIDDPMIPQGTIYYPDYIHIFNDSPMIDFGSDLQIEPGTVVILNGDFIFEIFGQINIGGVARNDSVLFTSDIAAYGGGSNRTDSWQGFIFGFGASDGSTFSNATIENAENGVNLGSVSASLDNTKIIYEDSISVPSLGTGIFIGEGSDSQIIGSEILGYTIGIDIYNEGLRELTTIVLTNNRVRNSPQSSRQDDVGIKISGNVDATIDSCEVYEYLIGIEISNDPATETLSTPVLTNNRVRNSPQSSRQEAVGIKISGYVAANIDNCDIEDYENGIQYIGSSDAFPVRETPILTNNRVRNSPQSLRTYFLKGIYVDSLASITIDNCDIEDYKTAIEIRNSNTARVTSTPVLTNNRVRNSPQSSREILIGLRMSGDINGTIANNEFVDCDSAFVITGNAVALIQHNLIFLTDILANSVAIYASDAGDLTINDNTVYQYEYGLLSIGTVINFFNNIFWHDSPTEEPVTIVPALLTGSYNNISRLGGILYPGIGNINSNPMFVDIVAEDFNLEWNSPCIDGGDPASPFDPDETINDIGLYYFNQPEYLESPTNLVFNFYVGMINLNWDLVSGAIGYNIYSSFNPYSGWILHDFNVRDLSWFGPIVGEKKFYLIKAYNSRNLSAAFGSHKKKNYLNLK